MTDQYEPNNEPNDELNDNPDDDLSDLDDDFSDDPNDRYLVFRDDRQRDFSTPDFIYRERDPRPNPFDPYPQPEQYPGQKEMKGQILISGFLKRAEEARDAHYAKIRRDLEDQKKSQEQKPKKVAETSVTNNAEQNESSANDSPSSPKTTPAKNLLEQISAKLNRKG